MKQVELQKLVEEISIVYFKQPFEHVATFNSRLRTTGGRYHLKSHNLDFNLKILEAFGMLEFIKVIKHELCHYHLHLAGKGYQHKDNDFKVLLKQTGGSRFVQSVKITSDEKKIWLYQCKSCQIIIRRQRRFNTKKFVCGKCKGKLILQDLQQ
ncbi:SprT-like protein [Carnobacterium iners]|uniref:SprT-like protein n=1 Tax=Carnobacterium iners TaxID=1073423 RepID=A0A1X7N6Z1_9LACT|nr:SprT family protein [Carnobacterium iners]SEK60579.1 SprT-like protein [Carnobacterium iners]SMH32259.1 SprT-like protein [Carnobacterium iners]